MNYISYKQQQLYVEDVAVADIVAAYGSPLYIYSKASIVDRFTQLQQAFAQRKHLICYAVKANPNLAILNLLVKLGAGFDIVSLGELERILVAGGSADKIVFSGVAKSEIEIKRALEVGIKQFNVESQSELVRINRIAQEMQLLAPVSLRINPNIDAKSHPYISTGLAENKFGIPFEHMTEVISLLKGLTNINVISLGCHIGSQITELAPFTDAAAAIAELLQQLSPLYKIQSVDLGGGLGVNYNDQTVIAAKDYITTQVRAFASQPELEIIVEPGRFLVAEAGILVSKVEYIKKNHDLNFAIVNAGMTDLIRPCLYDAYMQITEVDRRTKHAANTYDVVGPICESSDFLGKQRKLAIAEGDLIAVHTAGAYGASMSSNYNSRLTTAEVLIDGNKMSLIKQRAEIKSLWSLEQIPVAE